jgi:hypothetical protein
MTFVFFHHQQLPSLMMTLHRLQQQLLLPSTTNSPVDSTSDSSDFFLDLSGRPSLPPSEADDSDDEADEDDAEADGPPNLLPSQADDDDDEANEVAQPRPPPQRAAVMRNVALGKFFCVPTNST